MNLYKLLLIGSLAMLPSAAWAGDLPLLPEEAAGVADATVDAATDPLTTGTVEPVATGEAEEAWMTPAENRAGGGCHFGKAKSTVYYTN